jgi:hypothetical protein
MCRVLPAGEVPARFVIPFAAGAPAPAGAVRVYTSPITL